MGKSSKPKIEVTDYYMSLHYGICAELDAIRQIVVNEKLAWEGSVRSQAAFSISKRDLFGGNKKEGGVKGTVYFLPGGDTQILPDALATRLGRANGADCPGFRGLASIFMIGDERAGFLWTSNQPYLPGTWVMGQRRPRGLNPSLAMIVRLGTDEYPKESHATTAGLQSLTFAPGHRRFVSHTGNLAEVWSMTGRSRISASSHLGYALHLGLDTSGLVWGLDDWLIGPDLVGYSGASIVATVAVPNPADSVWCIGADTLYLRPYAGAAERIMYRLAGGSVIVEDDVGFVPLVYFADEDGNEWAAGPDGDDFHFLCMAGARAGDHGIVAGVDGTGDMSAAAVSDDRFIVSSTSTGTVLYLIDPVAWTIILQSGTITSQHGALAVGSLEPGAQSLWIDTSEISLDDLTVTRTIDRSNWGVGGTEPGLYDSYNHALIIHDAGELHWLFLDAGIYDANPAHIIFECLTNADWGMGSPEAAIDDDSFDDASQALFDENFGLSVIWIRQAQIQEFIQEVLDHIQAVLFVDPATGLLTLKLIRDDYDAAYLPEINPDNADMGAFSRKLWGEITNEIIVTWTNPVNEQEETVMIHDLASIATQGGIVSDSRNYYGVRSGELAQRLATRDLRSAGSPLASCEVEMERTQWQLRPASVVSAVWPEHGLDGVVMRVIEVDYGKPGDPTIKAKLVEDVFGLDVGAYVVPPTTSWEDPAQPPEPVDQQQVLTLPYYMAANSSVAAFVDSPAYPEVVAGILATTDQEDAYGYDLWSEVSLSNGSLEWQQIASGTFIGRAGLVDALEAEAWTSGVTFADLVGDTAPTLAGLVLIGDSTEDETEIAMIDAVGASYTLVRGILDTVPRAWPAGTPVWFIDEETAFEDSVIRAAGEMPSYKVLTRTSRGVLDLASAPLLTGTLSERPWLPSRPANVEVEGVLFNTVATALDLTARTDPWVTISWANRNRVTEDSQVLAWTDATVAPEDGQTTGIEVLAEDGVTVVGTITGLSGTSHDVPDGSFDGEVIVLIRPYATRSDDDGDFVSLQAHGIWVQVGDARITEDGEGRITEDGQRRAMED